MFHRTFWQQPVTLALALLFAVAVLAFGLVSHYRDENAVNRHQCALIMRLDGVIIDTLERSRKGLPSNRYFKRHPGELRQQLREVNRSIHRFKSFDCNA